MLSALAWIPLGGAARVPRRQELSKAEVSAIEARSRGGAAGAAEAGGDDDDDDLDDGDGGGGGGGDDDDDDEGAGMMQGGGRPEDYGGAGGGAAAEDDDEEGGGAEDDEEEADDLHARASDAFVVVANTEDDFSSLEVHCFNRADGSLYTHHDVTLPSFPLCLAWSDYAGDAAGALLARTGAWSGAANAYVGSYCAVGTFEPDIELWNLDVLDPLEPTLVLRGNKQAAAGAGAGAASAKGGRRGAKKAGAGAGAGTGAGAGAGAGAASGANSGAGGHSAAVISLSWNRAHRHLLASASADASVKVWDLDGGGTLLHTFGHHRAKVGAVAWNPVEATVLASASFDRTAAVTDAREAEKARVARYALPGDPECLLWNHLLPATFIVATDCGRVTSFDCRMPDRALWQLQAHEQAVTSVALSPTADGLMATASLDKCVKLWDVASLPAGASQRGGSNAAAGGGPGGAAAPAAGAPARALSRKAMSIGQLFTVAFYPSAPFLLAAGGSKGMLAVWDIEQDGGEGSAGGAGMAAADDEANEVVAHFAGRMRDAASVPALALRPRADGQPTA
jgi:periodic tryptophan protein 1